MFRLGVSNGTIEPMLINSLIIYSNCCPTDKVRAMLCLCKSACSGLSSSLPARITALLLLL